METNLKEIERTAKLKQGENKERIWEDYRLNDFDDFIDFED